MKKIFSITFLLLSLVLASQNNKQRAEILATSIQKHLSLKKEERVKLYELILSNMNSIDKVAKTNNGDYNSQPVMIEKRRFFGEMSKALTEDQFQSWQKIRLEQINAYKNGEKPKDLIFDPEMEFSLKK